ncbi:Wzz/FepE/Etk N-terminal domain-containing protein [Aromatoleum diolicum]|uniref:Polysaccharide chain length determinant N-terminal domain-containing protein n=1 Tax=Aromatoleum diolicum TaxID=75796 RepID=A0ABX1Q6C8_9RHOO|nr:Wzz/FepE/Etk N-terminal domain-containing protein [Aromatoleum diolicum]NMG73929.1 hypothetical protein [Aromatoleum diolicum]
MTFYWLNVRMHRDQSAVLYSENELNLVDLWDVLVRRRIWIVATLVVCIAGAIAYLLLKPPVYEARVKLRIGQVAGAGFFEPPEVLSSRLLAMYGEDVADGVRRQRPFLKQAAIPKGVPGGVELVVVADRPADATALLGRIFEEIQKTHQETFRENWRVLNERIQHLDAQRMALQLQFSDASDLIDRLKPRDPVQASLMMLERGRISASIAGLDAERPSLVQKLTPPQTQSTELLGEIAAPQKPAAPKRGLVLALAVILGVVGGVLLSFVVEFFAKARERPRRASPHE